MKQQQLTFDKGITNVPSDAVCADNTLEESLGMVYEHSEHRVIQQPKTFMTSVPGKLLYVHKYNDTERYIIINGSNIEWGTKNSSDQYSPAQETVGQQTQDIVLLVASGTPKITSIGKTLIISDANGLHYFLWKNEDGDGSYKHLASPFPEINVGFKMIESHLNNLYGIYVKHSGKSEGIVKYDASYPDDTSRTYIESGKQDDYNNLVIGLYSQNLKQVAAYKGFAKPFSVRMALELYDGTFTFISNPVLLFPNTSLSSRCHFYLSGIEDEHSIYSMSMKTNFAKLFIRQSTDFSDYNDVIKDVVLFATNGVDIYDHAADQPLTYVGLEDGENNHVALAENISSDNPEFSISSYKTFVYSTYGDTNWYRVFDCLSKRTAADIKRDLETDNIYYKVCSLGLKPTGYVDVGELASDYVIENLTTQQQLTDDYFSRNKLVANGMYAYNSRLNISGVSRGVFEGYDFFMPFDYESGGHRYFFFVKIALDTKSVWVRHVSLSTLQKQGIFFFYPDSRAEHVTIYREDGANTYSCVCDSKLIESESLNGAYYFKEFPNSSTEEVVITFDPQNGGYDINAATPYYNNNATELLPNYIITSEVNNPFVFLAKGYNKVGTGKIIGMSTLTQALSEGQFGQYPLLVFSESGIWAMATDNTGLFVSVHPMSREVCNNASSITQTDGAVFFSSEKGLMVVSGNQVKCVSEQLSGKSSISFKDYLKSAYIAYDYRDSLLWIFNNNRLCYVYAMKTSTFSRFDFGEGVVVSNIANNYPDFLLQAGTTIYSLINRPDINHDGSYQEVTIDEHPVSVFVRNTYNAKLYSRPMKLEDALALKTILQVRHIVDFNADAEMSLAIEASNNLNSWVQLKSLRGMPWKYYKFKYEFSNLLATDRFAGSVIVTEERRTNKLR